MSIVEFVFILVNLLSLFLRFRKQWKRAWWVVLSVNLTVFLIHGIFEGLRYQMAFSYVFVVLLAVFPFIDINQKSKTIKVLNGIAISLSFIFLVFTAFLAYALPVFTLPKPTGNYAVGIQYFHFVDENRTDPFLDQSTKKRELMVKVYYPAQEDDAKQFAPYFHSPELIRLFVAFYGMPYFSFDHLNLVKTNTKEGLQLSDNQPRYPVVLFSHGAGTTMEVQTSQGEDLASHGYIVVAIDHTYASVGTVFPDRIVSAKEATTNFDVAEPAEIITQIMADDSSFVIDQLVEVNDGKIESVFKGKIDLEKIGAIGHSVGGAVAYNLAINDSRVKAAIDLDGVVFITPNGDPKDVVPFLTLANDKTHIQAIENRKPLMQRFEDMDDIDEKIRIEMYGSQQAYQDAYDKAQQNVIGLTEVLKYSGELFTIKGSDHMKFIDIGLFIAIPQLRELLGIGGKTGPARCLEITKSVTLAFFDQHLKGETKDSLESLVKKYPELRKVDLK
jgi:predicted dienelactone hydrolase